MSRRKYFFSQKPSRGRQGSELRCSCQSFEALGLSGGFSALRPGFCGILLKKLSAFSGQLSARKLIDLTNHRPVAARLDQGCLRRNKANDVR
jgi:hypothetical protein